MISRYPIITFQESFFQNLRSRFLKIHTLVQFPIWLNSKSKILPDKMDATRVTKVQSKITFIQSLLAWNCCKRCLLIHQCWIRSSQVMRMFNKKIYYSRKIKSLTFLSRSHVLNNSKTLDTNLWYGLHQCWRRYWRRFWPFLLQHSRRAPKCHQYRNCVTNNNKLSQT